MSPLYAIVDVDACLRAGRSAPDVARAFLAGGARLIQIRAKHLAAGAFLQLVDGLAAAARAWGATLVVNDRVDVARAAGLGVHLGQDDLPVAAARAVLGDDAVVGLSTHTPAQLDVALRLPISYVAYGPIFATASKAAPDPVVGLGGLAAAARTAAAAGIPLVAIGGITLATAAAVRAQGATSVAVIGDLLAGAEGATERVRGFLAVLGDTQPV